MLKKKRGFTLVEMIIALGLASVIFVASIFVLQIVSRTGSKSGIYADAQQLARSKLEFIEAELRYASELEIRNGTPGELPEETACLFVFDGQLWRNDPSYSGPFSDDGGISGYRYGLSFSVVNEKVVKVKLVVYKDREQLYSTDVSFFVSNLNASNIVGLTEGNSVVYRNATKAVQTVIVSAQRPSITQSNMTVQMNAMVQPLNATNRGVIWSVEPADVATISADGVLTPLKNGSATVKAMAMDGSGMFGTKIIPISGQPVRVSSILIRPSVFWIYGNRLKHGDSTWLYAEMTPFNAENKNVQWSVDNTSYAKIQNGYLTAHALPSGVNSRSVVVKASATDGSGVVGTIQITIVRNY